MMTRTALPIYSCYCLGSLVLRYDFSHTLEFMQKKEVDFGERALTIEDCFQFTLDMGAY